LYVVVDCLEHRDHLQKSNITLHIAIIAAHAASSRHGSQQSNLNLTPPLHNHRWLILSRVALHFLGFDYFLCRHSILLTLNAYSSTIASSLADASSRYSYKTMILAMSSRTVLQFASCNLQTLTTKASSTVLRAASQPLPHQNHRWPMRSPPSCISRRHPLQSVVKDILGIPQPSLIPQASGCTLATLTPRAPARHSALKTAKYHSHSYD